MNDKVLVGPIHGWKRIPNYYKRNKDLYGELEVIQWDGKEMRYLDKEQFE